MEDVFVKSDLIDLLWKLGLIGNPTHDDVMKFIYRNRKQWEKIYAPPIVRELKKPS